MADVHGVIEKLVRRPFFWLPDQPLPLVFVVERDGDAFEAARRLAAPFEDCLPHATVAAGRYGTLHDLVDALAGEQGQLGRPVGGSFLPPPRFSLVQFVLWARRQRDLPPEPDRGGPPPPRWPDPQSRGSLEEFKERLKLWRGGRHGGHQGRRTAADFFGRAATTWLPVGTLAAVLLSTRVSGDHAPWWLDSAPDLVGVLPWALGLLVFAAGTVVQGLLSVRGSFFNGWFRRQPYLTRKPYERLAQYALRVASASDEDAERLLVHAMCQDLRQAYQKWIIPWPSWGRGLYGLLVLDATLPGCANERFLRLLEETTEETGLLPPMLVLAAVPEPKAAEARAVTGGRLTELPALADAWRARVRRRVPPLRLLAATSGPAPDDDYRPRLLPSRMRALGYWCVIALLVVGPVTLAWRIYQDQKARCGGLSWAELVGDECVGVVNADGPAPDNLFGRNIGAVVKKIDDNNAAARNVGAYVNVVLFGEYSIRSPRPDGEPAEPGENAPEDDSRVAGALAELKAVEQYQSAVRNVPRLQVLIANAGVDFRQGRRAARLVSRLAAEDPHTLGVIGFPRSVRGVEEAISVLHQAKIPMLSTTATADDLGYVPDTADVAGASDTAPRRPSPYYFRMAPTNWREAELVARFVRRTLLPGKASPTAVIVQDRSPGDSYTNNLARDYKEAAGDQGIKISKRDEVYYTVDGGGIAEATSVACGRDPDVILYAGRATEFLGFVDAVEKCSDGQVKVIAGDDVIKVVTDHGKEIGDYRRVQVYYAALASRELWRDPARDHGTQPTGYIQSLFGRDSTDSEDNLILSYDAVELFYDSANRAYQGRRLPSRGDLLYRLALVSGRLARNGSSGVIDFGGREAHDPVDKTIAIMRVKAGGGVSVAVRCGRLSLRESAPPGGVCDHLADVYGEDAGSRR
ncbi:hypothetical protein AB0C10_02485 [Microbispora amethystogenes]|uniref:ABC transporter substrate-binding protein n=1 Tax=Microbispora amethystogenes TaxID=1427754 RepID=UPI0033C52A54